MTCHVILEDTVRVTIFRYYYRRSTKLPKTTSPVLVWLTLTHRLQSNFSGGEAIRASEEVGLDNELPEDFVQKHVSSMYEAIQKLADFVKDYSK